MLTSARYLIVYPNPTRGDSADVPRDIGALVTAVEQSAMYGQGTLAARPVSSGGSPGIQGRFYMATDQTPMVLYYDYGTGWASVGSISAGSIGTTQLADGAVTTIKIADGNVTGVKIADGSITGGPAGAGVKIAASTITIDNMANSLKPSAGAGAGSEALRAIGSGGGNVVAGNDARLTDARTPSTGHDPSASGTVFPSSGLFNGYRYTLVVSGQGIGGWVAWDFIYRADLDGTYPWHFCGGGDMVSTGSMSTSTSGPTFYDLSGAFTVPRSGWYDGFGHISGGAGGGGGANGRLILGGSTFTSQAWGNQSDAGFNASYALLSAGNTVKMMGQDSGGFGISYTGYFGVRPMRLA